MAEGRIAELPPPRELLGEEAGDVVAGGEGERPRVRLERLHDHLPRRVAPAAAGELGDELEGPFLGTEVGQREPRIGVDDGGERDAREVVALRDHLRADEHDAVAGSEALERLVERAALPGRVGVEADPLELRQVLGELGLEPLRTRADPRQLARAAGRARRRDRLGVAAVVAVEPAVAVQRQRHVARGRSAVRRRRRDSAARARGRAG